MMDSDSELGGNDTNPRVESEPLIDGISSENRVDSASVHSIAPSDNSPAVHDVESVGVSDSVSGEGDASGVNSTRAEDLNKSSVSESDDTDVVSDKKHASVKHVKNQQKKGQRKRDFKSKESTTPVYDSMLSMFDEFAANGSMVSEDSHGSSMEASHGFEVGDMVWGKVKSHPWWPGHIFSEEFATPSVRRAKRDGLLLVAFFGDSSYGWFHPSEVIPFDPNFAEKSRQTNSKPFVRAVEEAIDEVSRRSALGLSCMCRNKQNFRQTDVKGYFAVDVTDYEPGAVYSIDAIEKARDSFKPNLALDFVKQLALEPTPSQHLGIDFIKNKASAISYRRAVYEEFDETYSQAFGYETDRSSPKSVQESASRKSPKAPLSGRQVFADTPNKGKSSNKPKDTAKKDKYLFKRRDEVKKEKVKVTSSPEVEDSITIPDSDYVLQKRPSATTDEPAIKNDPELHSTEKNSSMEENTNKVDDDDVDDKRFVSQTDDTNTNSDLLDDKKVVTPKKGENGPKKTKVSKRPVSEMGSEKSSPEKKKKRKKQHLMTNDDVAVPSVDKVVSAKKPEDQNGPDSKPTDFSRVLDDLHLLALDPFQTINRGRVVKTRRVFLKFRSLVFQKSLNSSTSASEDDSRKSVENASSSGRPEDPAKGGRKRGPSDRQEEMAAKKKKKVGDIRNLTQEKKVVKSIDEMKKSRPDFVKKTEQRATPVPTMLNMKFPPGGSLPSINELKARFARYGPLDHSATKIFWKTFTCRVVYRYKADAEAACRFVVSSGSLFGNTGIKCTIKEVGDPEPPVKPPKEDQQSLLERRQPPPAGTPGVQPKSILKKSGGEEAAAGNSGKGRVKFMLGGEESQIKSNTKMENKNGASFSSTTSSSSHAIMDFNSKNFQKGVFTSITSNRQPPLLPTPTQPPLLPTPTQPPNSMHYGTPPPLQPPNPPPRSLNYGSEMTKTTLKPPLLPPPPGVFVHNLQRPNIGPLTTPPPKVDISQQMINLLTKCNEVVTNVSNVLGYVPYRPL